MSKYLKTIILSAVVPVAMIGFLLSCENPFSNNLGAKVDIFPPVISVLEPVSGAYLQGNARFAGTASAHRELRRIDLKVFSNDEDADPLLDWTNIEEMGGTLEGEINSKEWVFNLDTLNFLGRELEDGFLKLQFRAWDPNNATETIELVYIVKNKPSVVKLTMPSQADVDRILDGGTGPNGEALLPPRVATGSEIRGQIVDRRGIKPGYPRIKIWPKTMPEPAGDDPDWGWAVAFLSGIDDPDQGTGFYADRSQMPVVRAANFVFKLAEFEIDPQTRHIRYTGSPTLTTGEYHFRILTSETFFYSDANENPETYMFPRDPNQGEVEAIGFHPKEADPQTAPALMDSGLSYHVQLVSTGASPTVELDNTDVLPSILERTPHTYFAASTEKKILVGRSSSSGVTPDFRLRILALHPDGIEMASLEWEHSGGAHRTGRLAWDHIGGSYINPDDPYEGYTGQSVDPNDHSKGANFTFTAFAADMMYEDGAPIFRSSSEPYTLTVTVLSESGIPAVQRYTLYLDGDGPSVNIRGVKGAESDPLSDGVMGVGGIVNEETYTVNGNIQVSIDRTANMGILNGTRGDNPSHPVVKWIVEEDKPGYLTANDTVLSKVRAFRANPRYDALAFFNSIGESATSGWVNTPSRDAAASEADRTNNFKFNTVKGTIANNEWNNPLVVDNDNPTAPPKPQFPNGYLWLYVIAQDGVENLGFVAQKIRVDDSSDIPVVSSSSLISTDGQAHPSGNPQNFIPGITLDNLIARVQGGSNHLGTYTGIELALTDDDGINLEKENVKIELTNLNAATPVTVQIPAGELRGRMDKDGNSRELTGVLTQAVMARAMYGSGTGIPTSLRDGLYKLTVTVNDNVEIKVAITPPVRPGDTPVSAQKVQTYFFVVQSDMPVVKVNTESSSGYPIAGSVQNKQGVVVWGEVRTPFEITNRSSTNSQTSIVFTPDVITPSPTPGNPIRLQLYTRISNYNSANPNVVNLNDSGPALRDADGKFIYYWSVGSVNFDPFSTSPGYDWRRFEVTAVDGLGLQGSSGVIEVEIDTTPPTLELVEFNYDRPPATTGTHLGKFVVNGKVPFIISAYDKGGIKTEQNGYAHVFWWIQRSNVAAPLPEVLDTTPIQYPTGAAGAGGQINENTDKSGDYYRVVLNTIGRLTDGAEYTLYAIAVDNADNRNENFISLFTFTVDQSSDIPLLNGLEPVDVRVGSGNLTITADIFDDDGFDVNKLSATTNRYADIRFPSNINTATAPNTEAGWGTWQTMALSFTGMNATEIEDIKISYATSGNAYFGFDGPKFYQIRLRDEAVAGTGSSDKNANPGKNPDGEQPGGATYIGPREVILPSATGAYSFNVKSTNPLVYFKLNDPDASRYTNPRHSGGNPQDAAHSNARPAFQNVAALVAALNGGYVVEGDLDSISLIYSSNATSNFTPAEIPLAFTTSGEINRWNNITAAQLSPYFRTDATSINDGMHGITIVATDKVGNAARVEWTFYKDASPPIITPTNTGLNDIITGGFILGIASDDLSNVSTTFSYGFNLPANAQESAAQFRNMSITNGGAHGNRVVNWVIPIPEELPDGIHNVTVWIADVGGNMAVLRNAQFVVDSNPPLMTKDDDMWAQVTGFAGKLTEPQRVFSAAGANNTDTAVAFTLRGFVYERNLSILEAAINPGQGSPAITMTLTGLRDWNKEGTRQTGDIVNPYRPAGNVTNNTIPFRVRRATPADLTAIAAPDYIRNAIRTENTFSTAPDPVPPTGTPTYYNNLYHWELDVRRGELAELLAQQPDDGVLRQVSVVARDTAGRNSGHNWRFRLDNARPKAEFLNAASPNTGATSNGTAWPTPVYNNTTARTAFDNLNLAVLVSDDTGLAEAKAIISRYELIDGALQLRYYNGTAWNVTSRPAETDSRWIDLLGSGSLRNSLSWTLNNATLTGTYPTNANSGLPEGRYRIELFVKDYSIAATAADSGNRVNYAVEFFVDRTDPTLTWVTERKDFYRTTNGLLSGNVVFELTAADSNLILGNTGTPRSTAEVRLYGQTTPAPNITAAIAVANPGATSTPVTVTVSGSGLAEGQRYTLVLTIRDSAGRAATTENTLDFVIDITKPGITLTTGATTSTGTSNIVNEAITGRVELRGNFTKTAGKAPISRIAYRVTNTAALPALPTGFSDAQLATNGWRFTGGTGNSNPLINVNGQRAMELDDGLATANLLIPNTRRLLGQALGNTAGQISVILNGTEAPANVTFDGINVRNLGEVTYGDNLINPLYLHFIAIDQAGNHQTISQTYYIYPEGDRPIVTDITNPAGAIEVERLLNGRIRLSGRAKDNTRVKNVWFRIIDRDPESPAGVRDNPITTLKIPRWDEFWDAEPLPNQTSRSLTVPGAAAATPGWFMANGGSSNSISWWAFVNTDGELDPVGNSTSRRIEIQVIAEDTLWNDSMNSGNGAFETGDGLLSRLKLVTASVVLGAPNFGDEYVLNGYASAAYPTIGTSPWGSIMTTNVGGRASYAITVKHNTGVGAIRWERPTGATTTEWVNLLDSNTYTNTTYGQHITAMNGNGAYNATTNPGIAAKAGPKNPVTGNFNITGDNPNRRTFMIWTSSATLNGIALVGGNTLVAAENQQYTVFTLPSTANSINVGSGQLIQQNAEGTFEWVVVADINTTILPYTGTGGGNYGNKADFYPFKIAATEISKSVPLAAEYTAQIPIDNLPPEAYYTHTTNVAGAAPTFGGEAGDTGTVSGLSRVVMWFSRSVNGTERSVAWEELDSSGTPRTDRTFQAGTLPAGTLPAGVRLPTGVTFPATVTVPNVPDISATTGNYSSIVIDRNDPMGSQSHHGHRHRMGFAPGGGVLDTSWYAVLDSTLMTSGRVTAHYIVYDKAGNASYRSQRLMILNGIPRISRITLATDIRGDNLPGGLTGGNANINQDTANGNGGALARIRSAFTGTGLTDIDRGISEPITVDTREQRGGFNAVYDEPFNVRNRLLAVQVDVDRGKTARERRFSIQYVSNASRLEGAAIANGMVAGEVYMIDNPGSFPWAYFGATGGNYRRGSIFLATQSGTGTDAAVLPPGGGNYGNASVWRLTLLANNTNNNGSVNTVNYTGTASAPNGGLRAEFVYGNNAFGTGNNQIPDFNPPEGNFDTVANGRLKPYLQDGTTPWTAHSLFVVRVYDSLNANPIIDDLLFGDIALLSIRVNNNDQTRPFAQLYDLNPRTEEATGLNYALDPVYLGDNRTKGGVWGDTSGQEIAKSGHIEPRQFNATTANASHSLTGPQMGGAPNSTQATVYRPQVTATAYFERDTVSGEVILRGYAQDDQRIGRVELQFGTGLTGAATNAVTILDIDRRTAGTALLGVPTAANAANRVSFTETIDLYSHRIEWAYLWNSETIPATVVGDVNVRVVAYNADRLTVTTTPAARKESVELGWSGQNNNANLPFRVVENGQPVFNPTFPNAFEKYNRIPLTLRPYVTGFVRNQTQFAHNTRSRQGRYMLAREETAVIKGFNLAGGSNNAPVIGLPGGVNITNSRTLNDNTERNNYGLPNDAPATRYRVFTVPNNATTGNGVVTYNANGTTAAGLAVNSRTIPARGGNRAIQPWNTERSPGLVGSDLWDDFTSIHIWQSDNTGTTGTWTGDNGGSFRSRDMNWVVMDPAMSIDPANGTLYASHNEGGPGSNNNALRTSTNAGAGADTVMRWTDPMIHSDVYRSPGGPNSAAATWTVSSLIGRAGADHRWHNLGGIYIIGPDGGYARLSGANRESNPGSNGTWSQPSYNDGLTYLGESTWYNASGAAGDGGNANQSDPPSVNQFMNPHIITAYSNNQEHIHVSYYDSKDGSIKYRYNRRGQAVLNVGTNNAGTQSVVYTDNNRTTGTNITNTSNAGQIPRAWTNLDGGFDTEDTTQLDANGPFPGVAANGRVVNFATRNALTAANRPNVGEHNAIAVTSEGYPVVAYYDSTGQRLKLAVSFNVAPVAANQWTIRDNVIPADNAIQRGTGLFVSMAIDTRPTGGGTTQNTVHIAAMNMNGSLVYIKGQLNPTQTGNGVLTNVTVQVVDNIGMVGRWCKISLDSGGRPWIAYQDAAYIGARDGVKLAYLSTGMTNQFTKVFSDQNNVALTGWETMHIPTNSRVENPITGTGELGRIGIECYPVRNFSGNYNATPGNNRFWFNGAAVSYLSSGLNRIAYYVP